MEAKSVCIGIECPFIIEETEQDGIVTLSCRKKPLLYGLSHMVLYSGPDDEKLINQAVVTQPCPLPPQKPS